MEKSEIRVSFDSEKVEALVFYLKKESANVQGKMDEVLGLLYEQTVPESVREYLDARTAPVRPKHPPRTRRSKETPVPADCEDGV